MFIQSIFNMWPTDWGSVASVFQMLKTCSVLASALTDPHLSQCPKNHHTFYSKIPNPLNSNRPRHSNLKITICTWKILLKYWKLDLNSHHNWNTINKKLYKLSLLWLSKGMFFSYNQTWRILSFINSSARLVKCDSAIFKLFKSLFKTTSKTESTSSTLSLLTACHIKKVSLCLFTVDHNNRLFSLCLSKSKKSRKQDYNDLTVDSFKCHSCRVKVVYAVCWGICSWFFVVFC